MEFTSKKAIADAIKVQITTSDNSAINAMFRIYGFQTADEQNSECTAHDNGVGFTGSDAEILSSFCKQYEKRGFLSPKQMSLLKKKIGKYAHQLTENAIANGLYVKVNGVWVVKK